MSNPFFSIIIPTYNRGHIIQRAIDSVLNQSFQNFELIIVDDGGIDNTESVIKNIADDRIRYYKQSNGGVSAARNTGASVAKGDYLIFLDSDDWLSQNYLEGSFQLLSRENFKLLLGAVKYYDQESNVFNTILPIALDNFYIHGMAGSFVIASKVYHSLGGYDEKLSYSENSDLFFRLFDGINLIKTEISVLHNIWVGIPVEDSQLRKQRHVDNRYENATYFLEKHKVHFAASLRDYTNYKRIQAISALKTGKFEVAKVSMGELIRRNPFSIRIIVQYFFIKFFPFKAQKYYS